MERRAFIAATSSLAVGLAGCSELGALSDNTSSLGAGSDGGDGSGSSEGRSPTETIQQFYDALDEGDAETAASLIHPDAPDQGAEGFDQEAVQQMADTDLTVEGTELVEQNSTRAVVNTTLSITVNGAPQTNSVNIELRSDNGTWKLYGPAEDVSTPTATATESDVSEPEAVVRRFYDRLVAGNTAGALDLLHPESPSLTELRESVENTGTISEFQVQSTSVVERSDTRVLVRIEFTVTVDGDTRETGETVELRKFEGAWRIYAYGGYIEEEGTPQETETPDGGGSVAGNPENVVRGFYVALGAGDGDAVRDLLHPDSPSRSDLDEQRIAELSEAEVTVEQTQLQEQSDTRAVVQTTLTVNFGDEPQTNTVSVELRPADGRWQVYQVN